MPPVYRPQTTPRVLQTKIPHTLTAAAGRSARGPSPIIQRYTEFTHPTAGKMLVSENMAFLKHADDTDLWAKPAEIKIAQSLMTVNKIGIVDLAVGEKLTFLNEDFYRVIVKDRTPQDSKSNSSLSSSSLKAVSSISSSSFASQSTKLADPFDVWIDWLDSSRGKTLGNLMTESFAVDYPSRDNYFYGAFSAIRTQLHLQIAAEITKATKKVTTGLGTFDLRIDNGEDAKASVNQFIDTLKSWKTNLAKASGKGHRFTLLPTECGGFSQMIMPGKKNLQEDVIVGDLMNVDGLGELPGPWKNHYAAVIMQDGGDTATLEAAASLDKWWFGMYGSRKVGQTFMVKTLLEKLRIGVSRNEDGAQACLDYLQAAIANDKSAVQLGSALSKKTKTEIDQLLSGADKTLAVYQERSEAELEKKLKVS